MQEKIILHLINELGDESAKTFNDIIDNSSLIEIVDKDVRIHNLNSINGLYLGVNEGELPKRQRTDQSKLPNIASMIQTSYFHVGGQKMRNQLDFPEGAAPLFLNQNIVIFNSMKYRVYLLIKYHLVHIDNLCQLVLQTLLERPEFEVPSLES